MHTSYPIQLTFGKYGHTLHHCQVISPDNNWIVYDTRNDDTEIGITTRIERVNIYTKEIQVLYETANPNEYGPGVGAVTYSPIEEKVLFIHGLNNPTAEKPYGMARRTGVAIETQNPQEPIFMDARDVEYPFTHGALKGGTHAHCWHPQGQMISFTYNDEVLTQQNKWNERCVGVMFAKHVNVPHSDKDDQISGTMFSVILTKLVENPRPGSDEIEKAFDECWVGNQNKIAFQGWVRDKDGNRKTEIFIVNIPNQIDIINQIPFESLNHDFPIIPNGVKIKRVTSTLKGVSSLRHWLRSSPDGKFIYFLMEDKDGILNIFSVNLENKLIEQVTYHDNSIQSPFNISSNGELIVYFCDDSLIVFNMIKRSFKVLIASNSELYGIPNFDKNDQFIIYNQYMKEDLSSKFLQIFKIEI